MNDFIQMRSFATISASNVFDGIDVELSGLSLSCRVKYYTVRSVSLFLRNDTSTCFDRGLDKLYVPRHRGVPYESRAAISNSHTSVVGMDKTKTGLVLEATLSEETRLPNFDFRESLVCTFIYIVVAVETSEILKSSCHAVVLWSLRTQFFVG